jgi:hypothetical protein
MYSLNTLYTNEGAAGQEKKVLRDLCRTRRRALPAGGPGREAAMDPGPGDCDRRIVTFEGILLWRRSLSGLSSKLRSSGFLLPMPDSSEEPESQASQSQDPSQPSRPEEPTADRGPSPGCRRSLFLSVQKKKEEEFQLLPAPTLPPGSADPDRPFSPWCPRSPIARLLSTSPLGIRGVEAAHDFFNASSPTPPRSQESPTPSGVWTAGSAPG